MAQADCRAAPVGRNPTPATGLRWMRKAFDLVTFYSRSLAVPERRRIDDPAVPRKALFYQAGCPACHVPKFVTNRLKDQPEQSFQLIWPYSDLLLHRPGPGLADNRPEGRASGSEWRTAPCGGSG